MKRLFYKFKRLIKWIPIIWKTNDWDYSSILIFISESTREIRKSIESGCCQYSEKEIRKMKICEHIIDRILDDEYFKSKSSDFNNFEFVGDSKDFSRRYKKSVELEKADMNILFKLMNKNIKKWWD